MNYGSLNKRILPKVLALVALINNPEVAPSVRQRNHEILFATLGAAVYERVYDMNAFDFEIEHTRGRGIGTKHFSTAKKASGAISTGDVVLGAAVQDYLYSMTDKAQSDAFNTARESGKFPIVTRAMITGDCSFCGPLVGTFRDPDPIVFARHLNCLCELSTEGYKSRNGLLDNYVKPQDR